ncbi:acyl-CoA dehydrogenase [Paenochrobactrum gallinarii]|uniref:Acyl-CoA dehydrogenase n=1 Tax=Paenochrobactrum gallinarii TaxID=643673 RepID=A0A841LWM6_9HYPH|nr:acyl-CoA dehydrogenase family protein [Paenochrobactrum gallinarii]MBB6262583.1 acyl-CoA dehydrogenase [Paenochrobactrum gallinarii]
MDFQLPEELNLFRETLRRFVDRELIPHEGQTMVDGRVTDQMHALISQKAQDAGIWMLEVPEKYGGQELGALALTVFWEEISRTTALPPRDQTVFGPMVGPILLGLNGDLADRYLYPVLRGEKRTCFAQTEPAAGADPAGIKTKAIREGDFYRLNGSKHFITDAVRADFAQVIVSTTPGTGAKGISCLLVDMATAGVTLSRPQQTMMGEQTHEINFDDVLVPVENLVGGEGRGFALAQSWITLGRIRHAARACGVAERCLELAAIHARQRQTFGVPLSERQMVQQMLADSFIELHATRLMMRAAAQGLDDGQDIRHQAYMCKIYGDEMSFRVADRCMQIHGALGLTPDLPIEQFWRDQRAMRITEGPSEVLRVQVAKYVLQHYAV